MKFYHLLLGANERTRKVIDDKLRQFEQNCTNVSIFAYFFCSFNPRKRPLFIFDTIKTKLTSVFGSVLLLIKLRHRAVFT